MSLTLPPNAIDVWHGNIPANASAALLSRQLLSEDELARADRFRFPELQQKFAQRRGVLRIVLANYLDLNPEAIRFQTNAHGKPFLCEQCNDVGLEFSLSHSKDRMLIAVTQQRHVGIDVEVIRPEIDEVGLAKSFFASHDIDYIIRHLDASQRRKAFFDVWTGKEAYVKAIGEGMSIPLSQFAIDMDTEHPTLKFAIHQSKLPGICESDWKFSKLSIEPNESICLAYTGLRCQLRLMELPLI